MAAPELSADTDDRTLLDRYASGDVDAFILVYRRYVRGLLFYARTFVHDAGHAEDLVQEAFLRLLKYDWEKIRTSFRAFLYTTVRNLAVDAARTAAVEKRSRSHMTPASRSHPHQPDLVEMVTRGLQALPGEQREVVVLKIYSDLTFDDIANLVSVPAPTVMSRYRYGLEKLSLILSEERGMS